MARVMDKETQEMVRDLENKNNCSVYVDDPLVFAADKIVGIRVVRTKIKYCIRWTGYSEKDNQWVAERHVTPELKRAFSKEKKKKLIKLLKGEKAKTRVKRKRHDRLAKSSILGLSSTPIVVKSTSRAAESDATMSSESDPEIPEWHISEDDNEHSDMSMSVTSTEFDEFEIDILNVTAPNEDDEGNDTLMSSEFDEPELEISLCISPEEDNEGSGKLMSPEFDVADLQIPPRAAPDEDNEGNGKRRPVTSPDLDESELEILNWITSEEHNEGSGKLMSPEFDVSDLEIPQWITPEENDEDSGKLMSTASPEFNVADELEIPKRAAPEEDNEGSKTSMSSASPESDDSGLEVTKRTEPREDNEGFGTFMVAVSQVSDVSEFQVPNQIALTEVNEENGTLVSVTLPVEYSIETTWQESQQY